MIVNHKARSMKRPILSLVFIFAFLAGCNQVRIVRLEAPDAYSHPLNIPFHDDDERQLYLVHYEQGWRAVASNYTYRVDLNTGIVTLDCKSTGFYQEDAPRAARDGYEQGHKKAKSQLEELLDLARQAGKQKVEEERSPLKIIYSEENKPNDVGSGH